MSGLERSRRLSPAEGLTIRSVFESWGMSRKDAIEAAADLQTWLADGLRKGQKPTLLEQLSDGRVQIKSYDLVRLEEALQRLNSQNSEMGKSLRGKRGI